jgi:regulator of cell morphogenesis and NO signaling
MSSSAISTFSPDTTVGAIVAAHPALARFFEHLGIDYCCGGKQPLAEACAEHGLDANTTLALLESAAAALDHAPTEVNALDMTLSQLADHIESTHHAYTKAELPRLVDMADRVASKHHGRDPRLLEVASVVRTLTDEMLEHMEKEEAALFPLIRRIETETTASCAGPMILAPLQQMELEHADAGKAAARLRELTDLYTPDAEACNTQRALLSGLAAFEADLHRHVHKENNVLFPRALQRASAGAA